MLSELEQACRKGQIYLLQQGLAQQRRTNDQPPPPSLLNLAATFGHLFCVYVLVDQYNADVNARGPIVLPGAMDWMSIDDDEQNRTATALYGACARGHAAVVGYLLQHGADPNLGGSGAYDSPLQVACQLGHTDVVRRLLEEASLQIPSQNNLVWEVPALHRHTVWPLLAADSRVDVSVCNSDTGETILHLAGHDEQFVDCVCRRQPSLLHVVDKRGQTPLLAAAGGPLDDAVVECLLKHGSSVNHGNACGNALHRAVQAARLAQVRALLEHATPQLLNDREDRQGRTPLMMACHEYWRSNGSHNVMVDVCQALLDQPSLDVNATDKDGRTVLHHASALGLDWLVTLVLEHPDICIATADNLHQTAAHLACRHNHVRVVQLLVHRGGACLVTPRDLGGQTPLCHAVWKSDHCVDLLYYILREHKGWLQLAGTYQ